MRRAVRRGPLHLGDRRRDPLLDGRAVGIADAGQAVRAADGLGNGAVSV